MQNSAIPPQTRTEIDLLIAADWTFAVVQALNSPSIPASPKTNPQVDIRIAPVVPAPVPISRKSVRFAHPAETVIADLLDAHGIAWFYEPTTFPLETTPDGRPLQSFTPDFYLPDCDAYIEMTTMRQSLVTRKNRKFRLLRERYPDLNVRLLYRRDVELISKHYPGRSSQPIATFGSVLVSGETVNRRLDEMAAQLRSEMNADPLTVLQLGEHSRAFAMGLVDRLTGARRVLLQMRRGDRPATPIQFGLSEQIDKQSHVILATDVIGTGLTAWSALTWLAERQIPVRALVTVADRKSARIVDVAVSSSIVSAPSTWLAGFGIGGNTDPAISLLDHQD